MHGVFCFHNGACISQKLRSLPSAEALGYLVTIPLAGLDVLRLKLIAHLRLSVSTSQSQIASKNFKNLRVLRASVVKSLHASPTPVMIMSISLIPMKGTMIPPTP